MIFAEMAWKNMFRYKKRTIITACAIAAGCALSIIMTGLLYGIDNESNRNIMEYETGAAVIYPEGYYEEREQYPLSWFIDPAQRKTIEESLTSLRIPFTPRVQAMAEVYFYGDGDEAGGSVSAVLTGVEAVSDASVFRIQNTLIDGEWPGIDGGAVIGSWLASDTGLRVGDYVTIECRGRGGVYQSFDVPVTGIAETPNPVVNSSSIFMDIDYLDDMLFLDGGVTSYALGALNAGGIPQTELNSLGAAIGGTGTELYTWQTLAADILALQQSKGKVSQLMLVFIFIIAAVGISNTMLMAVMERKQEIAMFRTLGYTPKNIRLLFVLEGTFIGCLGSAAGLAIGLPVNWYMTVTGIDLGFLFRDINIGYRVASVMRSGWDTAGICAVAIGAALISALAAWFPSGRILKKEIADNLR